MSSEKKFGNIKMLIRRFSSLRQYNEPVGDVFFLFSFRLVLNNSIGEQIGLLMDFGKALAEI